MSTNKIIVVVLTMLSLTACVSTTKMNAKKLPKGVKISKGIELPRNVQLAYYLPKSLTEQSFYINSHKTRVNTGPALKAAVDDAISTYFDNKVPFDRKSEDKFGLLLDIEPKWKFSYPDVTMTMKYNLFDSSMKIVKTGKKEFSVAFGHISNDAALYNVSLRATQLILVEVINSLKPSAENYPAKMAMSDVDVVKLANTEKPFSSGTGFFINKKGQILTAAHVLEQCLYTKVSKDGDSFIAQPIASSTLLDLAVIKGKKEAKRYLPLRKKQELFLGEQVTNVGYPLQGLLSQSPNLTRGNVSSHGGLKGSIANFQFSAPIQPGSSGGPVVSDGGELLGIAVSSLSYKALIEEGTLPQNVNFALNGKFIAKFLNKNKIDFDEVEPNMKGNIRISNDAALSSVVQLNCYQ
ncbi:S1 family peptidase [Parashewanella tropica]|uniref:S1 family peptidase n=1 Tax=Parashewanella tropica TaxID=2547970 RepID=UPI00105A2DCE|nr:serine protease [Parashewanella tropica]